MKIIKTETSSFSKVLANLNYTTIFNPHRVELKRRLREMEQNKIQFCQGQGPKMEIIN